MFISPIVMVAMIPYLFTVVLEEKLADPSRRYLFLQHFGSNLGSKVAVALAAQP